MEMIFSFHFQTLLPLIYFPSNGNVFVNKSCILVSQSRFSGQCKPLFYLLFRHWECIFERNVLFWLVKMGFLASGNHFFPFFRYFLQLKLFSAQFKFVFTANPSGQWKLIFWLLETIFCHFLRYPFYWKQFFHLVEIYFKRILCYGQWQQIFCSVGTIFFETIFAIIGRPILKKMLFLLVKTVFFNLFGH